MAEVLEPSETEQPHAVDADAELSETEPHGVDEESPPPVRKRRLYRRRAFLLAAAVVLLLGAIIGVRYWLYARAHESTDDAFIDGHIVQISPKVGGYVAKVYVKDNQEVQAGDLLAELDAREHARRRAASDRRRAAGALRRRLTTRRGRGRTQPDHTGRREHCDCAGERRTGARTGRVRRGRSDAHTRRHSALSSALREG